MATTSCSIPGKHWTFLPDIEKSIRGKDDENGFHVDCKYCWKYEPANPSLWRRNSEVPFGQSAFIKHVAQEKHLKYKGLYLAEENEEQKRMKAAEEAPPEEVETGEITASSSETGKTIASSSSNEDTKKKLPKQTTLFAFTSPKPAISGPTIKLKRTAELKLLPRKKCRGILSMTQVKDQ